MVPKAAVAFKLRFREPLVGSTVVGKNRVLLLVVENVRGFVASERGLYVNHGSGVLGILGIDNRANDAMRGAIFRIFYVLQGTKVEGNVDSEINASLADGHTDTVKVEGTVFFTVANHDIAATAADQFVDGEILEVAAIGDVDVLLLLVGLAEQL
jgi:hypothetical protein